MKRLLAAGSGDIYQICHVARGFEQSRLHNTEFTLVEWYRLGFDLAALMDEVEALIRALCNAHPALLRAAERLSYRRGLPAPHGAGSARGHAWRSCWSVVAPLGYRDPGAAR